MAVAATDNRVMTMKGLDHASIRIYLDFPDANSEQSGMVSKDYYSASTAPPLRASILAG